MEWNWFFFLIECIRSYSSLLTPPSLHRWGREEWYGIRQMKKLSLPNLLGLLTTLELKKKQTQNLLQFGLLINFKGLFILKVILIFQVCFLQRRRRKILLQLSKTPIFFRGRLSVAYCLILVAFLLCCIFIHKERMW